MVEASATTTTTTTTTNIGRSNLQSDLLVFKFI